MVFNAEELTALIGEYAAVIAHVTISSCIANALSRDLTDDEAWQCMNEVKTATEAFIASYTEKTAQIGISISEADADALRKKLNERIMLDCWVLMQKVTEETKEQTRYSKYDRSRNN